MPADAPPAATHRRVVVKFKPGVSLPYTRAAADLLFDKAGVRWNALADANPGIAFEPYFSTVGVATLRKFDRVKPLFGTEPFSFTSYYAVLLPAELDSDKIVDELRQANGVLLAYVEAGPGPPPSSVDPRNVNQHYQGPAKVGIGATCVWANHGIDGTGVGIVDLEQGWVLDHEDLIDKNIQLVWGENRNGRDHGTAVLGVVAATNDNLFGGKGIAYGATTNVVSNLKPGDASYVYTAEAIFHALCAMNPGDVLLIEHQVSKGGTVLPVEVEDAVFEAIRAVASLGIIVVEAAGNGTVDLDAYRDAGRKFPFQRGHADCRDSGAILVAAATSAVEHGRTGTTSFGSRIDCYAWGENIDTCNGPGLNDYRNDFNGTSGASAIVAGAAALLQAWQVRERVYPLSARDVRERLSRPSLNTKSSDPVKDLIGVMPDLCKIIAAESLQTDELQSDARRWAAVQQLLFGSADATARPPENRDLLVGAAIAELAKLLDRSPNRRRIKKAAHRVMKRAVKRAAKKKD